MNNIFSLSNKTILITGASSGIGKQTAIRCAESGAKLIISGRNKERLTETYSMLESDGHIMIPFDLNNIDEITAFASEMPELDGIMMCAGFSKTMLIKHNKPDYLKEAFNTNTFSNFNLVQALLKKKKIKNGGSIVFISSVASHRPYPGNSIYSATKGAINSFSKVLAVELAPQKIRVNCIQPGIILDLNTWQEGTISVEQWKQENDKMPLGFGKPDDIAYATIYLLSDASQWVTGSDFIIDGGQSIR